ncbi:hypothetical protein CY34DRAFT_800323 [Suillus luteus UH-Slu-Lm8-n1]|uniref:Heterokaryon incompatibility domain-containing protein n=1 Tax=Suillus luteus UH-Slu-Lm8-n1 TaxID=930992 RepID=A0A0D0AXR1_9AGAM|nr:hypothetical protein CY34DRAFT_800323 [Suillus luteus UH-Slu-Lm8-n1]
MPGVVDAARDVCLNLKKQPASTTRGQPTPMQTMQGSTKSVQASAFFKDGRRMVTGSMDGTLQIWDLQNGTSMGGLFEGHRDGVQAVAISPDERRIVSGGRDNTIIIWDVESKQMVLDDPSLMKHKSWVLSVCFSPDGKRVASGSEDKTVTVWDAETGAALKTLKGHRNSVFSVAFSPDGLKLASGSADRTIRVWQADSAQILLEIYAHQDLVRSVVWSADGQQLVSTSYDKTVKFWDSSTGYLQIGQPCIGHDAWILSLAISSDGSFIATASDDTTVRLWSTETHQPISKALLHTTGVCCVAISPDGELLVSGDVQGKVRLWSIKDILEQHPTEDHNNSELTDNHVSFNNHPSESDEASGNHSLFDILAINTTVRDASTIEGLHIAEELLTREIHADGNSHDIYANRSLVRTRLSKWDDALQDAAKSIAIQPSLLGYISKGIALCKNDQFCDAMEAFDLSFVFSNHDPIVIDLVLLIKAVALFNADCQDEAMRRLNDLATAQRHSHTRSRSVVNSFLRAELALAAFQEGKYSEATDRLEDSILSIADWFPRRALLEPELKLFTVLFGWNLDLLCQTVNQRRCDVLFRADRVVEAAQSYQYMMRMIDEDAKGRCLEWSTGFKKKCTVRCVAMGDGANYETAIQLYSAGLGLDPSCESLLVLRSKVYLGQNLHTKALQDAEMVIELNPSSYLGYELKQGALHSAGRFDEAVEVFNIMLSKLNDVLDRKLHPQYVSPAEVLSAIQEAIHVKQENSPIRLINTSTGHLYSREEQRDVFMETTEYKKILSSAMTYAPLETKPIKEAVERYFSWAMLSHRWGSKEPLLHNVQIKGVYKMDPVGGTVKLQRFCEVARDAGYCWAWSDTCCIDQSNNAEVSRSVNSMFDWYRDSALTIVYLSDVPPSSKTGALARCTWITRGWTVQEFLAPKIILFYQQDWTLYLDDRSPNHKESITILQELAGATGIDIRSLIMFKPGMAGAREKLRWSSCRVTTLPEDIAYSLFGIFGIHLSVIYGENKQNALGRLLQSIIARSGDITALDWVGKSSDFNSCLPATITSYNTPPFTPQHLSEDEMQTSVAILRDTVAADSASNLSTLLYNLDPPRFANSRLQLPCIAFLLTEVRSRRVRDQGTCSIYDVKADGLQDLQITTTDKLLQFSPERPLRQMKFYLVRPWNRDDIEFAEELQGLDDWPQSPSDDLPLWPAGDHEMVNSESHRALRLIARLGQPFNAFLLAQQRIGEYKRIASDCNIVAQVKNMVDVDNMMNIRTFEIL